MGNKTSLNKLFNKRLVTAQSPDSFWPLPGEFVGLEIEVENLRGDPIIVYPQWDTHSDASLRNGTEFVTSGPVSGQELTNAISRFFRSGLRYSMSPRTSVHIHINASDNTTVETLRNMFALMYVIEPAVFRWADENRKWCGYCSPLTDLNADRLLRVLTSNDEMGLVDAIVGSGNVDRYFGLNMAALSRHGTLEFRYFPCTDDEATLISWVKFVMYVKRAASEFSEVSDLLAQLRNEGLIRNFLDTRFPDVSRQLSAGLDFTDAMERVKDLEAAVATDTKRYPSRPYSRVDSPGLILYLEKNFPALIPQFITGNSKKDPRIKTIIDDLTASDAYRHAVSMADRLRTNTVVAPEEWGRYTEYDPGVQVPVPTSTPQETARPRRPRRT